MGGRTVGDPEIGDPEVEGLEVKFRASLLKTSFWYSNRYPRTAPPGPLHSHSTAEGGGTDLHLELKAVVECAELNTSGPIIAVVIVYEVDIEYRIAAINLNKRTVPMASWRLSTANVYRQESLQFSKAILSNTVGVG